MTVRKHQQTSGFERKGISLSTYSQGGYSDSSVTSLIDDAVRVGANHVVLGNIVLTDLHTGAISDLIEQGRNQTAGMGSVASAVAQAQAAGLKVVLKPQIAVHDPSYDQYNSASWINMVNPDLTIDDPAAFFANYKAMILDWATLAQQLHVDTLCIGNEMVAATKPEFGAYWADMIASIRLIYDGNLTYAALAPVRTNSPVNEIAQITFWDKLDYAGFDVYPSLHDGTSPSVADLNRGWVDSTVYGNQQNYVAFLNDMAKHVGKPIVFTETGLPSFDGASDRVHTSDGTIGNGSRADDQGEQADWWQSFFETWSTDTPAWLTGVYVTNNDPGDLGAYYLQNYNTNGKLAEGVIASWFGGHTDVDPLSSTLSGSQADDQLYLYNPAVTTGGRDLSSHLYTEVKIVLTASIINGQVPAIYASVNGANLEKFTLTPIDSGYVADDGTHWSSNNTFTLNIPGLVEIDELKIAFDGPVFIEGIRSQTFFQSISINGIALSSATYHPSPEYGGWYPATLPGEGQLGTASQWGGGYTLFDVTPWNEAMAGSTLGLPDHPIEVSGGAGVDDLHVLGCASDYVIRLRSDGSVSLRENSDLRQNAHLTDVEWLTIADGTRVDLSTLMVGEDFRPVGPSNPIVPTPHPRTSVRLADGLALLRLGAASDGYGNAGDNRIVGNAYGNSLWGLDGNDLIEGLDGDDQMHGGNGDDDLRGENGQDILWGGLGDDLLYGGDGDDQLFGGAGDDRLFGGAGSDVLDGGEGNDMAVMDGVSRRYVTSFADAHGTIAGSAALGIDTVCNVEHLIFADGILTFDADSQAAQVMRLYDTVLGRRPDAVGFDHWLDALAGGQSLDNVAREFANSAEFQAVTGTLSNEDFVEHLYNLALDRPSDSGDKALYVTQLETGTERWEIVRVFSESEEHRDRTADALGMGLFVGSQAYQDVAALYDSSANRLPDEAGLIYWSEQILSGRQDLAEVANDFAASTEFVQRTDGLNNEGLVTFFYYNALDRSPDVGGLRFWVDQLEQGLSRGELMLNFSSSAEHLTLIASQVSGGIDVLI